MGLLFKNVVLKLCCLLILGLPHTGLTASFATHEVRARSLVINSKVQSFFSKVDFPATFKDAVEFVKKHNLKFELNRERIPENFYYGGGGCAHTVLCVLLIPVYVFNWIEWYFSEKHHVITFQPGKFIYDANSEMLIEAYPKVGKFRPSYQTRTLLLNNHHYLIGKDEQFFKIFPTLINDYETSFSASEDLKKQTILHEALDLDRESYFPSVAKLIKSKALSDELLNEVIGQYCYAYKEKEAQQCLLILRSIDFGIGIESARMWLENFRQHVLEKESPRLDNFPINYVIKTSTKLLCDRKIVFSNIPLLGRESKEQLLLEEIQNMLVETEDQRLNSKIDRIKEVLKSENNECKNVQNKKIISKYLN
jgi:hypothetical protein